MDAEHKRVVCCVFYFGSCNNALVGHAVFIFFWLVFAISFLDHCGRMLDCLYSETKFD